MAERSLQAFYPELSRIGTETRLGAGAMLWHEGDPGDSVVLVLDGTLEVLLEAGDESEEVILRTLDTGALVGELASTDGRSAPPPCARKLPAAS
ncbi:MAG: cyclic nucleotide-binding domain-containing protein [Pseudomonadota bacterium]|nr:cyclic nucleotide-binding domain-containing protein [Pseudomonadota bacterium]